MSLKMRVEHSHPSMYFPEMYDFIILESRSVVGQQMLQIAEKRQVSQIREYLSWQSLVPYIGADNYFLFRLEPKYASCIMYPTNHFKLNKYSDSPDQLYIG